MQIRTQKYRLTVFSGQTLHSFPHYGTADSQLSFIQIHSHFSDASQNHIFVLKADLSLENGSSADHFLPFKSQNPAVGVFLAAEFIKMFLFLFGAQVSLRQIRGCLVQFPDFVFQFSGQSPKEFDIKTNRVHSSDATRTRSRQRGEGTEPSGVPR